MNDIEMLNKVIDFINSNKSVGYKNNKCISEELGKFISEEEFLEILRILKKINKRNIVELEKVLMFRKKKCKAEENKKNKVEITKKVYSYDTIVDIFGKMTNEEISNKYKLKDLVIMYKCIYGKEPTTNKRKSDLIILVRDNIHASNRGKAFKYKEI